MSSLTKHLRVHTGEISYKCSQCNKTFKQLNHLTNHKKIHPGLKNLYCEYCKKTFITATKLRIHLRVHTGERPYKCQQCQKTFTQSSGLYHHKKIHSGLKNFNCEHCKKRFITAAQLRIHFRVHTGERPYKCQRCNKTFTQSSGLYHHKKIHSGLKKFNCEYCKKQFIQKFELISHLQVHTDERPYKCLQCNKTFTRNSSLYKHKKVHSGIKEFNCDHCRKQFVQKSHLIQHLRVHTGKRTSNPEKSEKNHQKMVNICIRKNVKSCAQNLNREYYQKSIKSNDKDKLAGREKLIEITDSIDIKEEKYCGPDLLGITFDNLIEMTDGQKIEDKILSIKAYDCNHCKQSFSRKILLINHLKSHAEKAKSSLFTKIQANGNKTCEKLDLQVYSSEKKQESYLKNIKNSGFEPIIEENATIGDPKLRENEVNTNDDAAKTDEVEIVEENAVDIKEEKYSGPDLLGIRFGDLEMSDEEKIADQVEELIRKHRPNISNKKLNDFKNYLKNLLES